MDTQGIQSACQNTSNLIIQGMESVESVPINAQKQDKHLKTGKI